MVFAAHASVSPGLTVIANALRVGDRLIEQLSKVSGEIILAILKKCTNPDCDVLQIAISDLSHITQFSVQLNSSVNRDRRPPHQE